MKKYLLGFLLVLALVAFGCSGDEVDCVDTDGDGYGSGNDCQGKDCDDSDPACHEGVCCGDCTDVDGDGYGEGADCLGTDCDDNDADRYPGKTEICDGKDNDCDGVIFDSEADADEDGVRVCDGDCNDNDANCHQAGDACCTDCTDVDGDGYGEGADCDGPDCDDNDAARYPGNTEVCDGKDNDCNDVIPDIEADADSDGFRICEGDCNDDDPNCHQVGDACCTQQCVDDDGDGYGLGASCLGSDCNDNDIGCWEGACCPAGGNCRAMISCVQNCADQPCVEACYALGDADAKALMDDIFDCITSSGCAPDNWTCIGAACWQPMAACYQDNS